MSNINEMNYNQGRMKSRGSGSCRAWSLLMQFYFTQRSHLPPMGAELALSPAQCHLLHALEADRPLTMGQLAERLACDASNITGLADRLESRGLVRRRPSPEDRRVKVLDLTPAGVKVQAQLRERMTARPPTLERLSPREREMLARLLARLLE
jgi:DNA-binding MarR family transcriptional regulator